MMHVPKVFVFFSTNQGKHFLLSNQKLLGKHLLLLTGFKLHVLASFVEIKTLYFRGLL